MSNGHPAPFTRLAELPKDLAAGLYLVFVVSVWEELRLWRIVRLPSADGPQRSGGRR